jgi:hypothetical protein
VSNSSTDAPAVGLVVPAVGHGIVLGRLGEILLLGAIALLPRLLWLDAEPHVDELYHLLAAEGLLERGEPAIGGGLYERALLFTHMVAWSLGLIGPGLEVARLPSVAAGLGLVLALFLWLRHVAGPIAAWTGGLLLALSPLAVELSQLARFYALHALVFWLAAGGIVAAVQPGRAPARRTLLLAGAALLLLPALHLQDLTLVGVAGLALWLAILAMPALGRSLRDGGTTVRAISAAALLGGLVLLAWLLQSEVASLAWAKLRFTPLWAEEFKNQVHFYHLRLAQQFPVLWPLTGLLALAALAWRPRAAGFCLMVFATGLALGSLAGMKDDRYLFYALPFLFALWAIAAASLAGRIAAAVTAVASDARRAVLPALPRRTTDAALVAGAVLFAISAGSAPAKLAFDLVRGHGPEGAGRVTTDWWRAAPSLRGAVRDADVVIVSDELAALAALGRADVVIARTRLSDAGRAPEFAVDPRTGVRMVSEPASILAMIACRPNGLVLLADRNTRYAWAVPPATSAMIEARTTPLPLPHGGEIHAFTWQTAVADIRPCPAPLAPIHR